MAVCDDCFEDFLHPLVHESQAQNDRFREKYGLHARWDWDHNNATLTFSDPKKQTLEIDVSIVGTTEGNFWQWAWANKNIPPYSKTDIEKIREFGQSNGYDKLTIAFLDADEYTGWKMTSVAVHLLGGLGSYRFPTGRGYCYLVYRKIKELTVQ